MKREMKFSLGEVALIEVADILGTLGVVGLFLAFSPIRTTELLIQGRWPVIILAVIAGAFPVWKMLKKEKGFKGQSLKKVKRKK